MGILVDTGILIEAERRDGPAGALMSWGVGESALVSVITLSELLQGARRANPANRVRRLAFIERLIGEIETVPIDDRLARVHAAVGVELARAGTPIPANDLWIAATALHGGHRLATLDAHFERVPGLEVIRPA